MVRPSRQPTYWCVLIRTLFDRSRVPLTYDLKGLAVSGGVDSMALATLCSRLRRDLGSGAPIFTGFIVDHGLRSGSREEALQVARYLKDLGMIDIRLLQMVPRS